MLERVCGGFDVKEISFGLFFGMDTKARVVYRICFAIQYFFFGRWIFCVLILILILIEGPQGSSEDDDGNGALGAI